LTEDDPIKEEGLETASTGMLIHIIEQNLVLIKEKEEIILTNQLELDDLHYSNIGLQDELDQRK
jgi:hypothetical protein